MPLRSALLVVGAIMGLLARASAANSSGISFATRTPWGSVFLLGVGWSLILAAVIVMPERRRVAWLLFVIGMWWFVSESASPSVGLSLVFTIALVLYPSGPALLTHVALSYPTGRLHGRLNAVIVVCGYAVVVGIVGVGATTVFDPQSAGCPDCPTNLLLITGEPSAAKWMDLLGLRLGAGWLLLALGAVAWRVVSAGPGVRRSVGPVAGCAALFLAGSAVQYLASLPVGALDNGEMSLVVWGLQGATLVALAATTCVDVWRARRARRNLTRLVVELRGVSPGGLRTALAERLGDRDLLLAYPIDAGRRYVDAGAHDVDVTPTPQRAATRLVLGGVELATLVHKAGILTQAEWVDDLAVSVQLALESERLAAEDLAQLAEIRWSGARIVAAGDAERRRIERDLHDGAQQRLIALLLSLRLISEEVTVPALAAAEAELRRAIADLRQLAHGVYPVLLKDAGLHAALDALVESRPLIVRYDADERYPDVIETTAYLLVARLCDTGPIQVWIGRDDSRLVVEALLVRRPETLVDVEDRISALGGQLDSIICQEGARVTLALPVNASMDSHQRMSQTEP